MAASGGGDDGDRRRRLVVVTVVVSIVVVFVGAIRLREGHRVVFGEVPTDHGMQLDPAPAERLLAELLSELPTEGWEVSEDASAGRPQRIGGVLIVSDPHEAFATATFRRDDLAATDVLQFAESVDEVLTARGWPSESVTYIEGTPLNGCSALTWEAPDGSTTRAALATIDLDGRFGDPSFELSVSVGLGFDAAGAPAARPASVDPATFGCFERWVGTHTG